MFAIIFVVTFLLSQPGTGSDIRIDRSVVDLDARSADRLAQTFIRQHDALHSLSLVYNAVLLSYQGESEGDYWRRAIIVNSAGMFRSENSHSHDGISWSLDARAKTLVITPMESTVLENLNRCVGEFAYEYSDEAPAVLRNQEKIFEVLCWWPFVDWPAPQLYGHAYSMRELLDEGSYRLLPSKERVRGKQCYTLIVNDILTVWCDFDQPECILKSERYNPTTSAIDSRFEMMEHEEVGDNIWLPKKFRIVRFDSNAHTPQLRERVVFDRTFLVSDIKINEEIFESDFRQEYAPGTVRSISSPKEFQYEPVVPGQLEHFDSILEWCRLSSNQSADLQGSRWSDPLLIFGLFFLVGCGVVVVIVAVHRAQRKRAPGATQRRERF